MNDRLILLGQIEDLTEEVESLRHKLKRLSEDYDELKGARWKEQQRADGTDYKKGYEIAKRRWDEEKEKNRILEEKFKRIVEISIRE